MFVVPPSGVVTLQFTMPRYYLRCAGFKGCKRIAWAAGESARLTVAGYLEQANTVVRVEPSSGE
jgi:hypothetical protein